MPLHPDRFDISKIPGIGPNLTRILPINMTRRNDSQRTGRVSGFRGLSAGHPGYGLVSARKFARLRADDLVPRYTARVRKSTGYGSTVEYPEWTRAQLERLSALEEVGITGATNLRILLWIEGFPIPIERIAADLMSLCDSAVLLAERAQRDLEADRIVFEMLERHDPSQLIKWARALLPRRCDLETALLQMVQLASGTSPADLMLDPESAQPIQRLLGELLPGLEPSAAELATVMSLDDQFANFMHAAASFPEWSLSEWIQAREDQLVLRQLTRWPLPPERTIGDLVFAGRFACLIACGAMRQSDRDGWESRIREMKASLVSRLHDTPPIDNDLNSREAS